PGELEQLHSVGSGKLSGRPESLEQVAQLGILQHVDAGGELKMAAAHQLAHDVDQLRMVLHSPVNGGIEVTPGENDKTLVERVIRLDLSIHHRIAAPPQLRRTGPAYLAPPECPARR